jgi:hypothetical protein
MMGYEGDDRPGNEVPFVTELEGDRRLDVDDKLRVVPRTVPEVDVALNGHTDEVGYGFFVFFAKSDASSSHSARPSVVGVEESGACRAIMPPGGHTRGSPKDIPTTIAIRIARVYRRPSCLMSLPLARDP